MEPLTPYEREDAEMYEALAAGQLINAPTQLKSDSKLNFESDDQPPIH